jgi:hypothetical protein
MLIALDAVLELEISWLRESVVHLDPGLARVELVHVRARADQHAELTARAFLLLGLQTLGHLFFLP